MKETPTPAVVVDLDLRLVRYFTVVAEHLNFARAAEELRVAQPSLSRQIQRLEQALGVQLLDRSTQGSRLTAAGAAFLPRAQQLLHSARSAVDTALAAAPHRTITIGYVEDLIITAAVRNLRQRYPHAHVRARHLKAQDTTALLKRQVDVLVTRTPLSFSADGLTVTVLYDDPRVLLVSSAHRLAGKESVTADDIAAEPLVGCAGMGGDWTSFWRLEPRPDGQPAPLGPTLADSYEDKLEAIAEGSAIAVVPATDPRVTTRQDLVVVPLQEVAPSQVVVVTRTNEVDTLITQFLRSAKELLTSPNSDSARR
jgi:DNA-binding transcriptional LysR family regulator